MTKSLPPRHQAVLKANMALGISIPILSADRFKISEMFIEAALGLEALWEGKKPRGGAYYTMEKDLQFARRLRDLHAMTKP